MKLTPAEYRLLDAQKDLKCGYALVILKVSTKRCANRMRLRGLISKRAWTKGYVVATALGKRSHARGKS